MPRVIHFELPVDDVKRAKTFYEDVFGWKIDGWDNDEGYWLMTTGTSEPGIDGALISKSFAPQLVNIIGVDSVDDYLARAEKAGATVVRPKQEIPGVGYAGYVRDPEGNVVGLFEPSNGSE
jgi:predicted enzyme related to lactoylglutathione lyase